MYKCPSWFGPTIAKNKVLSLFCNERLSIETESMMAISLVPTNWALMIGMIFRMESVKFDFFRNKQEILQES